MTFYIIFGGLVTVALVSAPLWTDGIVYRNRARAWGKQIARSAVALPATKRWSYINQQASDVCQRPINRGGLPLRYMSMVADIAINLSAQAEVEKLLVEVE